MLKPLRILIAEDSEDDLLLILRHLHKGGYAPLFERVDNLEALKGALEIPTWDVILCDYVMPQLSVSELLKACHERGLRVPVIVISGVFGEYVAARAIAAGAHDYIVKGDLERLATAIENARRQAGNHQPEIPGRTAGESGFRAKGFVRGWGRRRTKESVAAMLAQL